MGQAVLLVGLLVAAPPPSSRPAPEPDHAFAESILQVVQTIKQDGQVRGNYGHFRKPPAGELVAAAVAGLYAAAERPVPAELTERATGTESDVALKEILARARAEVGNPAALAGRRAFLVAAAAAGRAADPYTILTRRESGAPGGSELEFGLGFELHGLQPNALEWLEFELSAAESREPPAPPLPLPWRVGRVLPGGPAADAGLLPGDVLTSIDGTALTPATAGKAMAVLFAARSPQEDKGKSPEKPVQLTVTRAGSPAPVTVAIIPKPYTPDSVFGYRRTLDGRWSYFPDRASKIGYIRVGFIEFGGDEAFAEAVDRVLAEQPDGLILDLRWCPGGYVDPCKRITSYFLKQGQVLFIERKADGPPTPVVNKVYDTGPQTWSELPLAVLVSPDTAGGGEMVVAALQDHKRAIVVGQRTFGRASTSTLQAVGDSGLSMRVTYGYSDRPTGKNRHRQPGQGLADEWGVRPDPGCVVPVTPDYSRRLREWADRQALRAGHERTAGPLDDPLDDPQRALAEKRLRERIATGKP